MPKNPLRASALAAAGCLGSGIAVITFTNPFYSALALGVHGGVLALSAGAMWQWTLES